MRLRPPITAFFHCLAIVRSFAAADRNNTEWQRDLSISYGRVGDVLVARAYRFVLAREFARALEVVDQAISLAPNEVYSSTRARAHALMFLGRVDEARSLYLLYRG